MRKVALTSICLMACVAMATAGMDIGALASYQDASDGDAGMGVGAMARLDTGDIIANTFAQGRLSYLTGFGENDLDVTAIPIEIAAGYISELSNGYSVYGMGILGYYMMDLDDGGSSGGVTVNGVVISTSSTSYDIDNAVGFALVAGIEKSISDTVVLFSELRYQILDVDVTATKSGSGFTQFGTVTVMTATGSYTEAADMGGIGITAGARIAL